MGADDVGSDEVGRAGDRTIDMLSAGEMHDGLRLRLSQNAVHRFAVTYVGQNEVIVGWSAIDASEFKFAAYVSLSTFVTSHFRVPTRCRTRAEPMKPAPPVTTTLMSEASPTQNGDRAAKIRRRDPSEAAA